MTNQSSEPKVREFGPFEVAKICGVFYTTVLYWVNHGKLKARYTVGGHRRIALPELLRFMKEHDIAIPPDLGRRRKNVLVVEDDHAVQRLFMRVVEGIAEVKTRACRSGLEALIAIGREAPDLLILDIRIPEVNGAHVCKLLRSNAQTRPIKIIAVSGEILGGAEKSRIEKYADVFLEKPVATEELRRALRRLLNLDDRRPKK